MLAKRGSMRMKENFCVNHAQKRQRWLRQRRDVSSGGGGGHGGLFKVARLQPIKHRASFSIAKIDDRCKICTINLSLEQKIYAKKVAYNTNFTAKQQHIEYSFNTYS